MRKNDYQRRYKRGYLCRGIPVYKTDQAALSGSRRQNKEIQGEMKNDSANYGISRIVSRDGTTAAEIVPELGAVVSSWSVAGRNGDMRVLLYHRPFFWEKNVERTRGGIPFLFPVCGRMERDGVEGAYMLEHRSYRMQIHGFAARMPWQVADDRNPGELTLELRQTEATMGMYPFRFSVRLTFRVDHASLVIDQCYMNTGNEPMPYYAGFHPYFLTPQVQAGKEKVRVDFKAVERLVYNQKLTDIIGSAPLPGLPASVSDPDINEMLVFTGRDCRAVLTFEDGMGISVSASGMTDPEMFQYLQFFTIPEEPFFCVEPWMAFPNAMNTACGTRWLEPGEEECATIAFAVENP